MYNTHLHLKDPTTQLATAKNQQHTLPTKTRNTYCQLKDPTADIAT